MSSKQEKLAAARKKLKEFQGKQRESDTNKRNVTPHTVNTNFKDSTSHVQDQSVPYNISEPSLMRSCQENVLENPGFKTAEELKYISIKESDIVNAPDPMFPAISVMASNQSIFENSITNVISSGKSELSSFANDCVKENRLESSFNNGPSNYANGSFNEEDMAHVRAESYVAQETSDSHKGKPEICTLFNDPAITEIKNINTSYNNNNNNLTGSHSNPLSNDPKNFFWTTFTSGNKPNEMEPSNNETTVLSVSQLAEENNNLSQILKRTEELLKYKTDQEQNLSQNVSFLQLKVTDLEGSILNAENEIQKLKLKNEQLLKQRDIDNNKLEDIKQKYDSKIEQYSELQQKLELKAKEYEHVNMELQEAQTQLSSSLIKIQQLQTGESPALNLKLSELQDENATLTQKLQYLEKSLHNVTKEKKESSHSFQTYAQQCNAQLGSLSSEVRNLANENQRLTEKNSALEKVLKDLETQKIETNRVMDHPELKSLTDKLIEITEENKALELRLKEQLDDIEALKKDNKEKLDEINQVYTTLKETRSENLKLIEEREKTNSNEKLLAAMESDKVAAARAVSQNQKLKDQISELEEGFIKLSHEKLQLTDELAHEKHLKKEIELRLQELQTSNCPDHDDNHHHSKSPDTTINESADVEELRNIIRQLEEDKTELIFRLNSIKTVHHSLVTANVSSQTDNVEDGPDQDEDSDTSKMLLQQMEEKVKKTMNEIATLDEEKEKLEHLVLQLQSETETIGEYISLYQNQRLLLRQRSKEKDDQLLQLSKDKEELKSKLTVLNNLVNHLLIERGTECQETPDVSKAVDGKSSFDYSEATAAKIQTLITEIQSTNLINNQSVAFEHCPCCSGRLIII